MATNELTDKIGSVTGTLCALHCAVCAFLPVVFTGLGLGLFLGQSVEWFFSLVAVVVGLFAIVFGLRTHGSKRAATLLVFGVLGILASRGLEMGTAHHDHGGDHHTDAVGVLHGYADMAHHSEHAGEASAHAEPHGGHDAAGHLIGAIIGIVAGVSLVTGHVLNIRAARRRRDERSHRFA